jgi:hypothetical protein
MAIGAGEARCKKGMNQLPRERMSDEPPTQVDYVEVVVASQAEGVLGSMASLRIPKLPIGFSYFSPAKLLRRDRRTFVDRNAAVELPACSFTARCV